MSAPHSSPSEALQTMEAAEDRTAWGPEDYAWDNKTFKAVSKSTSPKEGHHPCSAPATLAQAIPQISGELQPKSNTSNPSVAPSGSSGGDEATDGAAAGAGKQGSTNSYGRPGYCQADGCGKSLSKLTFYHVRNKICEVHIKVDKFSREGVYLRFCQRCGYPHPLDEFDGTKHSCRAQLEKHNARRRKRQAEAAAQKGGKQQAAARGGAASPVAAVDDDEQEGGALKVEQQQKGKQQPRRSSRRQKTRFTAAEVEMDEEEDEEEEEQFIVERTRRPASIKVAPAPARLIEPKQNRAPSPTLPFLDFNTEDLDLLPAEQQQQKQQQQQPGASSGRTTDSTSPIADPAEQDPMMIDDLSSWLDSQLAELQGYDSFKHTNASSFPPLPHGLTSFDFASGLMGPGGGGGGETLPSTSAGTTGGAQFFYSNMINTTGSGGNNTLPLPSAPHSAPAAAPKLTKEALLSTVSVKLFGCTPAELPTDLRAQLAGWFHGHIASLEGYLRPGCVHLTVQATVEPETQEKKEEGKAGDGRSKGKKRRPEENEKARQVNFITTGGVSCVVEKMLSSGEPLWRSKTLLVQAGNEVALVHGGTLKQIWEIGSTPGERAVPAVLEMKPVVLLSSAANNTSSCAKKTCCGGATKQQKQPEQEITIKGVNLLQDDCEIVCRLQGDYVAVESAGCAECCCSASVKACCQSSGAASGSDGTNTTAARDWEAKCCGCCVAKLTSLSLQEPPEEKNMSKKKKKSSCCATTTSTEALVDTVTPQLASLRLDARRPLRPGVLHIDVLKNAFMAPQGGRVLVVDSPAVHTELLQLAARAPAAAAGWVDALGIIFEWIGDRQKIEYSIIERTAATLLHEAIRHGLVEIAKYLHGILQTELMAVASSLPLPQGMDGLDALAFLGQAEQTCKTMTILRAMKLAENSSCDTTDSNTTSSVVPGMTLLHLAVQSQNPSAVELVLGWRSQESDKWRCDFKGPYDLTPLHLATLVRDPVVSAQMVLTLIASCDSGVQAWTEAMTSDGLSPADLAHRLGRVGLLATFGRPALATGQKQLQQEKEKEEEEEDVVVLAALNTGVEKKKEGEGAVLSGAAEAPSTPRRCKCTGPCPCALSAEPCASCSAGSCDDEGCCGSENGQCCCCSSGKSQEEEEMQQHGGCCAATTLARACCH